MIRTISIVAAALAFAVPATAQGISQDDLNARYDRALAAGYKAMFLCSATANAERNGASRTLDSVRQWELSGIQQPLDGLIDALEQGFYRDESGVLYAVAVEWSDTMPPRIALHREGKGCSVQPTGFEPSFLAMDEGSETATRQSPTAQRTVPAVHSQFPAAFDGTYGEDARTTAVIVAQDGVIREAYADGFNGLVPQRTWSVAKSIAATLVGAAVQRGDAAVAQSAGLGEGDDDPRRAITIDHALRMASGRYSDTPGNRTDPLYFGGATVDEVAVDWPLLNAPGSTFRYANNDTLAAVQAIEHTLTTHPPSELLARLGMNHTVAETDWQGNYILSSQVWSTAPDLLRLGQLYLNDGVLPDGTRVLPEGWVEYVSTPSGPQPEGRNMGYGAGWWLFNNHEGIPADTIAAQGNRGQYVVVVPSRDVVIVRRGEDPAGGSGFDIQAFTADVLAALAD